MLGSSLDGGAVGGLREGNSRRLRERERVK